MNLKQILKGSSFLLLSIWLVSCTRYKEVAYFQDVSSEDSQVFKEGIQRSKVGYQSLKVRTGDILQISIQTIAPSNSTAGISMGTEAAGDAGDISSTGTGSISGYLVDNNGEVELPLVGKIKVGGLSIPEIKNNVRIKAEQYYKDPVVNVRLANFVVTVLGEVARPGTYIMYQEKSTLLDALGMAGDMTIFGKRTNVLLTREVNGKEQLVRFNMNSTDIFNSPYFYLKQGDVVYVQPTRGKAAANDLALTRTYTIIASTLSLLVVAVTRFKN